MNYGLTPASQRSPFRATTISLTGMLLCVLTTLGVLVSVSRDQSGATLVELTSSFSGSLRDHGRNDLAVVATVFRHAAVADEDLRAIKSRSGVSAPRYNSRNDQSSVALAEENAELFSSKQLQPVDVNGPVFLHLMTELQRYCQVSPAEELGGQLALDLHSQISQSEDSIRSTIERILKTCRKSTASILQSPAEFEIIVWASTPATESLAAASEEAFTIEQSLESSFKAQSAPAIVIGSSGRIWTRPQSPRPLATVVVRVAEHSRPRN